MKMSDSARAAAIEEFRDRDAISSIDFLLDVDESNPTTLPDNPFDFIGLLDQPASFFPKMNIPFGTEVAVIGAGNAGIAAAYLLMRVGLKPVVYDITGRVGGRSFTVPFERDPEAQAELGSMRIPLSQKLIFYLLKRWGIHYKPFQNPLVVDTVVDVNGQQVFYDAIEKKFTEGPKELIAQIEVVSLKYNAIIDPIKEEWDATKGDHPARLKLWKRFVDEYNNVSLYQMLIARGWTLEQINLFGYIGIGSGGFDSFFPSSFLEIVRVEIQRLETEQQIIIGGTNQISHRFWTEEVECLHWGTTSLAALTGGLRPGIAQIRTRPPLERQPVTLTDTNGVRSEYQAVILSASPRAVDMTLNINQDAFSIPVWTALRNVEVTSSEKVFILTETAFWKDPSSGFNLYTTLTDQPPRQIYTFDSSDWGTSTKRGVVCLSYSWASSSIRYNALDEEQRVQISLDAIEHMNFYGPRLREKLEKEKLESVSICWEDEYGYSGGYRMANPGQAVQVKDLHAQSLGQPEQWNNGLYLAGEALSWYGLSGWIDGAIKTGLQAAISAILRVSLVGHL